MTHSATPDRSPAVAELLDDAFVAPVGVETAARHLWAIHHEAGLRSDERERAAATEVATDPQDDRELVSVGGAGVGRVPRAAVPLLVILMVMSSSGMALAASRSSLPGDMLYSVKRGTEQAQLIFARSPEARAHLQLSFARTRLEEIRLISSTRPQLIPALVADIDVTLSDAEGATPEISPVTDRIRQETTEEVAALQMTTDSGPTTSSDPTVAGAPATSGSTTTTVSPEGAPSSTPPSDPNEEAVASTPGATPKPSESAAADSLAGGDGELTDVTAVEDPLQSDDSSGTDPEPSSTSGGGTTSADDSGPSPSPSPSPSSDTDDGPVVTTRPNGDSGGGATSRTEDDEESDSADPAPSGEPEQSDPPPPSEPVNPYVRPDDTQS